MKPMLLKSCLLVGSAVIGLGLSSCKPPQANPGPSQPPAANSTVTPGANQTPTGPAAAEPAQPEKPPLPAKVVSPEDYWAIQLARLELVKKFWEQQLEVYQAAGSSVAEARGKVVELRKAMQSDLKKVFADHGLSAQDFFPGGEGVQTERDKYLQDHPALNAKIQGLKDAIQSLRRQVREISGRPGMRRERPGRPEPQPTAGSTAAAPGPPPR